MKLGEEILYLCNADVERCGVTPGEAEAALEAMFAEKAAGRTVMKPKQSLQSPGGALFLSMPAGLESPPRMGLKWVGVAPGDRATHHPHISGLVVLNDSETGMPLMVMDARWITGVRTAAITGIAAKHLARRGSSAVGFIACGVQARTNLAALMEHFEVEEVRAYSRRLRTAVGFAGEARALGIAAEAVEDPRAAVEGMDIVVTSVPIIPPVEPFLDVSWLAPGAFVAMVDLGKPWLPGSLGALDRVVTDDYDQSGPSGENLGYPKPYDAEVAELVAGERPGRESDAERTALLFGGPAVADVAVAEVVYERARAEGIGRVLAL